MKLLRVLVFAYWPMFYTFPYVWGPIALRAAQETLMRHPWWRAGF